MRVVKLAGELDIFNVEYVREQLAGVDGPAMIDLSGVRLISAAALTELQRAAKRAGYGSLTLVAPQPHVRRVLEIAQFDRIFRIVDSVPGHVTSAATSPDPFAP